MPKEMFQVTLHRPTSSVPWGFCVVGGKDQALTFKIGNVKKSTPASRAGLMKMDYLIAVNDRPVFLMDHLDCVREIKSSGQHLKLDCERGDHIVPSFDEMFPGLRKQEEDSDSTSRKKFIDDEYYKSAMEHHGLGHMPQPDNFTTVGNNLGIEINQYNCPVDAYSDGTIQEMKTVKEQGRAPVPGKGYAHKFDPTKSNAIKVIDMEERGVSQNSIGGRSA